MYSNVKKLLLASAVLCFITTPLHTYADTTPQDINSYNVGRAAIDEDGGGDSFKDVNPDYKSNGSKDDFNLRKYNPSVTVVHSINNTLSDAYYKPSINDIPLLEEKILQDGKFIYAYTGFFDLDRTEPYKPETMQSRALELLGYDLLLESESYSPDSGYQASQSGSNVTKGKAIMDIYKALGRSQFDISLYYSPDNSITLESSPAAKDLPSYVTGLDTSRGRTDVFITRSNKELYYTKAETDLGISRSGMNSFITNGDFIVLLSRMMYFYGEPVLSDAEMNMLLQVYGADIPTYLTPIEQDAYLYLKSRGVLNVELDYIKPLNLNDMLDILMCVYDKDSRTDFKQIQVTMDIGEDLINKGYFPRTVSIVEGDSAIDIASKCDYANATYYDYYIEITDETRFVDRDGGLVEYLFIPSMPEDQNSSELQGSKYNGIVTTEDGKSYYHFQINVLALDSDYMQKSLLSFGTPNFIQINTRSGSDYPTYVWMEQGGGVYTYASGPNHENGVTLHRRGFNQGEFEGSICIERVNNAKAEKNTVTAKVRDVVNTILGKPIVAYAAPDGFTGDAFVELTIQNADKIASYATDIPDMQVKQGDNNTLIVTIRYSYVDYFESSIKMLTDTETPGVSIGAISTVHGDMLVSYNDLVEMGLFFTQDDSGVARPEDDNDKILILDSKYGQVKLNNETKEIVVGNVIYRLPSDSKTVLFEYGVTNEDGLKSSLMIDYRAAFGWTNNIANIVVTGSGNGYTVNVKTIDNNNSSTAMEHATVRTPPAFSSSAVLNKIGVVNATVANDGDKHDKAVISTNYALANWMVFSGIDKSSGLDKSYVFIFYPKDAFPSNPPNDIDRIKEIVGYAVSAEDWACRVVEIPRDYTDEPGKISYHEKYGYIYNLPEWSDFTMDKYLSGEYLLPLSKNKNEVINANVNVFSGYPYGSRPTSDSDNGVDIKWQEVSPTGTLSEVKVKAAPAGVSVFFGGKKPPYIEASSPVINQSSGSSTRSSQFFYGTSGFVIEKGSGDEYIAKISFTSNRPYEIKWKLNSNGKLYKVHVSTEGKVVNGSTYDYQTRWVMYSDILKSDTGIVEDQPPEEIKIADGEQKDKYHGFEEFSLEYLIGLIDYSSSWVIYFVFKVIPLVGIICITILVGISMISDMKIVRLFCNKFIDPVKILTLGRVTIEQLDFKKAFLGLMLGYIGFAFMLDGNLLRIIMWLLEFYDIFMELIKQM